MGLSLIYRSREQQALQFIREAGYLTGDLPHLLGQLLRQAPYPQLLRSEQLFFASWTA